MASIKSAEFKAQRAKVHLDALKTRIRRFVESEAEQPTAKDDLENKQYLVTLTPTEPPIEAALIYGDFISCLRAALEHLAWNLASIAGKPTRDTCFPIRHDNTVEAQVAISKATLGFPEEA